MQKNHGTMPRESKWNGVHMMLTTTRRDWVWAPHTLAAASRWSTVSTLRIVGRGWATNRKWYSDAALVSISTKISHQPRSVFWNLGQPGAGDCDAASC